LNFFSIKISEKNHYSTTRANISEKVSNYFINFYPQVDSNSIFFITNGQTVGHEITDWGSSRQIAFALGMKILFKLFIKIKA
jgi:hypothetical protein